MRLTAIAFVIVLPMFTWPASAVDAGTVQRELSAQAPDSAVRTPAAGSATRTAILDAVRQHLRSRARFKVGHIRATDRWAFVRCVEVVDGGGELQETDLDVAALLERRTTGRTTPWVVADSWTLSTNDERPYTAFARRVRARASSDRIPSGLFQQGFLSSDVPVQ